MRWVLKTVADGVALLARESEAAPKLSGLCHRKIPTVLTR